MQACYLVTIITGICLVHESPVFTTLQLEHKCEVLLFEGLSTVHNLHIIEFSDNTYMSTALAFSKNIDLDRSLFVFDDFFSLPLNSHFADSSA